MSDDADVRDDGVEAERAVLGRLFARQEDDDPHALLRSVSVPGCRHAVVDSMLRDPRFGPPSLGPPSGPFWAMFTRWLINLDGERHRRVRRHFQRLFTPRNVERFREVVAMRAASLLDPLVDRGAMDLAADFARPLPFAVILDVLGVDAEHRERLGEQILCLGQAFAHQQDPAYIARADTAVTDMQALFSELLDRRAAEPRDDLLSILAASIPPDADGRPDLLANCVFFIEAGHATTTSLISVGTLILLEHPDQLERLRSEPAGIPVAVEELLRLITPVSLALCSPREDASIGGYHFPAGVARFAFLAAANRDRAVYEEPDAFVPGRREGHLAFSAGPHFCLGAPLARLHGEIALTEILARLPGLRLAAPPVWRGFVPLNELEHLPVVWAAAAA